MAKIHFLGTCSGTEPMAGMHHTSIVIEVGEYYYWFDGGEGCAYTAHTSGMDVLRTKALFVSHPHLDHMAGLPNLFSCMRKLIWREKRSLKNDNTLEVFFPGLETFRAIKLVACSGNDSFKFLFKMNEHDLSEDGVIFEDENIKVSAMHNCHLGEDGSNGWHSYSFLIEIGLMRIVYSGDVKTPTELDEFMEEGCDLFIMETGHHSVTDVCEYAMNRKVERLYFTHHGREIINNRPRAEKIIKRYSREAGIPITIASDMMTVEI